MNSPIAPALSEDEWMRFTPPGHLQHMAISSLADGCSAWIDSPERSEDQSWHACAALCLYDQPFGFTQEDVHDLDICLLGREPLPGTHLHRIKLLRDKILALLPPHHP